MQNLAVIPARSGSQRIKDKNIKMIDGHPLMYYQIECAKNVKDIRKTVVATDSVRYSEIAKSLGAEVIMRPTDISGPNSQVEETLLYVISELEKEGEFFDNVVLLQATSPLNRPEYVQEGIDCMRLGISKSVITYYNFIDFLLDDPEIMDRPMSQNKKPKKTEAGCFWITDVKALKVSRNRICSPCATVEVPKIASWEIDSPDDFRVVEALLKMERNEKENYR